MYSFLTSADKVPDVLPGVLAGAFGVQVSETDVSDSSDWETRNWDALVTCEYERLEGDLTWSLSVYEAKEAARNLSEEELAVLLSTGLNAPVFFAWGSELPWIRRVAQPGGGITLARVVDSNDDGTGFSIQGAESAIAGFPNVPVTHFSEVVRAFNIPTPVTDSVVPLGTSGELENVRGLLVNWERLCIRMRSDWPPSGWYSAEMYQEDLKLRDQLEVILEEVPDADRITAAVSALDAQYRELSVEDRGSALCAALEEEGIAMGGRPWYWQRRPAVLPWADA
ncbi:hypothetical protein [Streptomyces sp. NPDC047009]|uniref:hypothetical protein n=1 Tax=Streptomyces sp. NPDC047009 TaxID=3154496 RepID=UPI0033E6A5E0